jgi:hypothetical protein
VAFPRYLLPASLLTLWPGMATAGGPAPLDLEWVAPPGCPEKADVAAEVERLVGTELASRRHLTVRAVVAAIGPDSYSLSLQSVLDGVSGERTLTATSCRAVTDAAVLTMALALNPDLKWPGGAAAERPAEPAVSDGEAPPTHAEPAASHPDAGRRPLEWLGRTLFGMRAGSLPQASPELGLGLGASKAGLGLWLLGSYSPPTRAPHAEVWMLSSSALLCYSIVADLGPCGGVDLSWVRGRGDNVTHFRSDAVSWLSAAIGLTGAFRLERRWKLRLEGQALFPMRRPEASVAGLGVVYRPGPWAGRAFMGLELTIR